MTDYEKQFAQSSEVCGPPFPEIMDFFAEFGSAEARVLDLGCGQGRDAIPIARYGHRVTGVDISPTGVAQLLEQGAEEELLVEGYVADVVSYVPVGQFDVVLLDRVLHTLSDDTRRLIVLQKACRATVAEGYVLVADTPKHMGLIRSHFAGSSDSWRIVRDKGGFLFAQRTASLPTGAA